MDIVKLRELSPALNPDVLEKKLLELPQVSCEVFHHFGPGLYIRELRMKAGTLAMGHLQRMPHMNVMLQGKVEMLLPDGTTKIIQAPQTFMAQPGRKIGYVLEDTVWQNIYPTDETDIEALELMFLDKSDYAQDYIEGPKKDITHEIQADWEDYKAVLTEFGFSPELVAAQVNNLTDQIPLPYGWPKFSVRISPIHGRGVFASADLAPGEPIAPASIKGMRTPAGRYTNHSKNPNSQMLLADDGIIYLVAIKPISGCIGGGHGEELTIDYRQALSLVGAKGDLICQDLS